MKRERPVRPTYLPLINYHSHPIGLPVSARVAIDLKQSPPFATSLRRTDSPIRKNRADVVLMKEDYYLFENRWVFDNELVDYNVFQFFDIARFDFNPDILKRIKIYGLQSELSWRAQADLLIMLSRNTRVEHLELDQLELLRKSRLDLYFSALRVLSISAIRIVSGNGHEEFRGKAAVLVWSPRLEAVYSGLSFLQVDSFKFMQFTSCDDLILFVQHLPPRRQLREATFVNLKALAFNNYRREHCKTVRRIARGALLPQLKILRCNSDNLQSTSYRPEPDAYADLQNLYGHLINDRFTWGPLRPDFRIFIHGVAFDPAIQFLNCGLHSQLVKFHFDTLFRTDGLPALPVQACPSVMTAEYLEVLDTFLSVPNGSDRFFRFYPNLRVITLNNQTDRRISADRFLEFLQACTGLTELELHSGNFGPSFYARLVQLDSLFALNSLVLFEKAEMFNHSMDFGFLQNHFRNLRNFHTNAVNRVQMLRIADWMQLGHRFLYEFDLPNGFYLEVEIWFKVGTYWDLRVECRHREIPSSKRVFWQTFQGLAELKDFLARPHPEFALRHWLDHQTPAN